ncbi:hypothetical protein T10_10346 [Trichinella papuae]|uniref:Uncharacterized protein n=1 Tax=Trichinella papuae TaxID=268474 RepID=A0A0V1M2L7_9BILA|nr:hypothetical protein T10_10346 [Trichinella papuae]
MLLHPCLLGIDFLWPRNASINLGQECDIGLLETVTLPAQTEMMIAGRSDRSWTSDDRFLKPKMVTNYSVMAACSLSRAAGGTVPLETYSTATTINCERNVKEAPNTEAMSKYSEVIQNMLQLNHNSQMLSYLETLSGADWFSTLDLESGYWQVEAEEEDEDNDEDEETTALPIPFGFCQFRVMPFLLLVLKMLRHEILHYLHSGPEGGHLGKKLKNTPLNLLARLERGCSRLV